MASWPFSCFESSASLKPDCHGSLVRNNTQISFRFPRRNRHIGQKLKMSCSPVERGASTAGIIDSTFKFPERSRTTSQSSEFDVLESRSRTKSRVPSNDQRISRGVAANACSTQLRAYREASPLRTPYRYAAQRWGWRQCVLERRMSVVMQDTSELILAELRELCTAFNDDARETGERLASWRRVPLINSPVGVGQSSPARRHEWWPQTRQRKALQGPRTAVVESTW